MSSLQALYFFGTLPEEAIEQIQSLLEQGGWIATRHITPTETLAIVTWTIENATNDALPENEMRPTDPTVTWFSRATKRTYYSDEARARETLRKSIGAILRLHHLPTYIGDDYGAGGDDNIPRPTLSPRCVIGAVCAGQRLVFVKIP